MLAYGYVIDDDGTQYVRYRTSWASGDNQFSPWTSANWTPNGDLNLPLRGVIGYHPRPKLVSISESQGRLHLRWDGPMSRLRDATADTERPVHAYVVERASTLRPDAWTPISIPWSDSKPAYRSAAPMPPSSASDSSPHRSPRVQPRSAHPPPSAPGANNCGQSRRVRSRFSSVISRNRLSKSSRRSPEGGADSGGAPGRFRTIAAIRCSRNAARNASVDPTNRRSGR